MYVLYALRLMCDLAFYYSFAAFFASFAGNAFSLVVMIFLSVLYALSGLAGPRRPLRTAILLPGLLCLLLPGIGTGGRIALLPALAYGIYLAREGNYSLSHERQEETFLLFVRIYPVFFLVAALTGSLNRLTAHSLLPAVLTLFLSVFLLRILRHDAAVYRSPRFLMQNLLVLAGFAGLAWLLHLPVVTKSVTAAVSFLYNRVIAPILIAVFWVIGFLLSALLSPLMNRSGDDSSVTLDLNTSFQDLTDSAYDGSTGAPLVGRILEALFFLALTAVIVLLLIRFFRRLAGDRDNAPAAGHASEELRSAPEHPAGAPGSRLSSFRRNPVHQVRRQYRRYLELCRRKGFTPDISFTSQDIRRYSEGFFSDPAQAAELRELYILARYHGIADKEDASRAKELVDALQRQLKTYE